MSYYKRGITKGASSKAAYQKYRANKMASSKARYVSKRNQPNYIALRKNVGEKKGMDTPLTLTDITNLTNTNGSAIVLNLIQQGNGSWNRVGRQVYLKSVRLVGQAQFWLREQTTTGNLDISVLRMVVVWDNQPSGGTIPTWDTIFGVTDQSGTESSTMMSPPKYDNMRRFKVLRDCILEAPVGALPTGGTTKQCYYTVPFDEYIKLGNKTTVYQGQSTPMTITDISTGALYVYFRTPSQLSDFFEWQIRDNSLARLRYTD